MPAPGGPLRRRVACSRAGVVTCFLGSKAGWGLRPLSTQISQWGDGCVASTGEDTLLGLRARTQPPLSDMSPGRSGLLTECLQALQKPSAGPLA